MGLLCLQHSKVVTEKAVKSTGKHIEQCRESICLPGHGAAVMHGTRITEWLKQWPLISEPQTHWPPHSASRHRRPPPARLTLDLFRCGFKVHSSPNWAAAECVHSQVHRTRNLRVSRRTSERVRSAPQSSRAEHCWSAPFECVAGCHWRTVELDISIR